MTDKQILVVRMHITYLVQIVYCWLYCLASWLMLSLGRSRLSGSTLWWEKTPSSRYVGSVINPFRVVGVTQRHILQTYVDHHLKAKHSEQYVEFEKALERGEEDKGKGKAVLRQKLLLEASV